MSADTHPRLAREGWVHIAVVVVLALGLSFWHPLPGVLGWILVVFVVQFFRDPHREIPTQEGVVVSPADGKVIAVTPATDPELERPALKISVFMNVFNVHSNRAPVSGEIIAESYRPGSFVNAALAKASTANEARSLTIRSAQGELTCVQIAGLVARRIKCYVNKGDSLTAGQRYGFIRFGSRVDVYLPPDSQPRVAPGDVVSAGSDVIALLPDSDG